MQEDLWPSFYPRIHVPLVCRRYTSRSTLHKFLQRKSSSIVPYHWTYVHQQANPLLTLLWNIHTTPHGSLNIQSLVFIYTSKGDTILEVLLSLSTTILIFEYARNAFFLRGIPFVGLLDIWMLTWRFRLYILWS